jgi:hypothetical protein
VRAVGHGGPLPFRQKVSDERGRWASPCARQDGQSCGTSCPHRSVSTRRPFSAHSAPKARVLSSAPVVSSHIPCPHTSSSDSRSAASRGARPSAAASDHSGLLRWNDVPRSPTQDRQVVDAGEAQGQREQVRAAQREVGRVVGPEAAAGDRPCPAARRSRRRRRARRPRRPTARTPRAAAPAPRAAGPRGTRSRRPTSRRSRASPARRSAAAGPRRRARTVSASSARPCRRREDAARGGRTTPCTTTRGDQPSSGDQSSTTSRLTGRSVQHAAGPRSTRFGSKVSRQPV